MFLYVWAALTVAAMTPAQAHAAPRLEPVVTPAAVVQPVQRVRKRRAPTVIAAPAPAKREIMTLGWADEDEVPHF